MSTSGAVARVRELSTWLSLPHRKHENSFGCNEEENVKRLPYMILRYPQTCDPKKYFSASDKGIVLPIPRTPIVTLIEHLSDDAHLILSIQVGTLFDEANAAISKRMSPIYP